MLDEFKNSQYLAYNILNNAVFNNKLSHAYLFDCNENFDGMKLALSFAKLIICNDLDEENKENVCRRIDDGNYMDIRIIESDGLWIKKEDVINLQNEFSKRAIEGKKKIYIINEAEKMNTQTANSILKFLEEPVDDIVAILLVNNINLILPTILSRCQVIKLNKSVYSENCIDNFFCLFSSSKYGKISIEEANSFIDNIISFAFYVESNGLDSIIYSKKIWHSYFCDRDSCIVAMNLLIILYMDVLRNNVGLDCLFFGDRLDVIKKLSLCNDLDSLIRKINIFIVAKNSLGRNLNINLLVDKLIIDLCGD